ncbi:hypothetical protein BHE74_00003329 [Ensete ventricosum]|nr:hypothetical protein BHE74_00003329 [Ensete ventricosum]
MAEHVERTSEKFLNNIMEKIADTVPKQKSVRFFEEQNSVSAQMDRLFGRQNSVHKILGGGKCKLIFNPDVLFLKCLLTVPRYLNENPIILLHSFGAGFVCAHTLPVLYEKNEDQVDGFLNKLFGQMQSRYRKLDGSLLSKIPKGNLKFKKKE